MKNIFAIFLIMIVTAQWVEAQRIFPGLGAQRAGISAFPFLKIGVNPRAAGMGEAFTAVADDASSLYWNPAVSVRAKKNEVLFAHTLWFADVQHSYGALLYHLSESDAIGASVVALTTDEMPRTTVLQPQGDGSTFVFRDIALGLTYSRAMTDQFSFGVTGKYVHETLAELVMQTFLVDVGAYYYTGYANSRFAIVLTNFGGTAKPAGSVAVAGIGTVSSFQDFSPPTVFRMSFAIEPWQTDEHRMTTAIQLNHPNDNAENLAVGIEYSWNETVFIRTGYKLNVEEQQLPSAGMGLKIPVGFSTAAFDYAFSHYGDLGMTHRFSVGLTL